MPVLRCMVILNMDSGIRSEACVNTFYMLTTDRLPATLTAIKGHLQLFYQSVDDLLTPHVDASNCQIKIYDLDDPEPRAPLLDDKFTGISPSPGTPAPPELAICISFQGLREAGHIQARRRGRIYLGPLKWAIVGSDAKVNGLDLTQIRNAANTLLANTLADPACVWVTHSKYSNENAVAVYNGWVDNAFDIQRRRGTAASTRASFP